MCRGLRDTVDASRTRIHVVLEAQEGENQLQMLQNKAIDTTRFPGLKCLDVGVHVPNILFF